MVIPSLREAHGAVLRRLRLLRMTQRYAQVVGFGCGVLGFRCERFHRPLARGFRRGNAMRDAASHTLLSTMPIDLPDAHTGLMLID